ncbi:flavin reductase (NADPH)-like [Anneissia japonica]|uniref:flavin reductase (NADPH)-like n=1 Tax=Anneissia japonica TaxID=1529436 RepID=UPI0014259BDE|nr:flavin reductase (NADPH)-like [Anneissia japonica]
MVSRTIMKLAILGATGPTGIFLTQQAVEAGHDVVLLVRNLQKVQMKHDSLTVAKGDIFSESFLAEHFNGCDAVLSCLGTKATFISKITFYTDSMKVIISAMRTAGIKRLVAITSWCTGYNRNDPGPAIIEWFLKPLILRTVLANMAEMETFLESDCNDIDYTTVRPPGLKTDPPTEKPIQVEERQFVGGGSSMMNRGDVARFMLDIVNTEKWFKKFVAVAA